MMCKRLSYLMLAIILVFSTFPFGGERSYAAVNLEILNWAKSVTQPAEPSRVTTPTVDLEVEYTQIAESDLSRLYYVITEVNTGITREVRDHSAERAGSQKVVFRDVDLQEGLNKIQVFLDSLSNPQSIPVWIYFTEVATISNLTVDGELLTNGKFVPVTNPLPGQANIFINGVAPNATSVTGYTTLTPGGRMANVFFSNTGEFSFMAGNANVDLELRPGDNELTVLAANPFKTYRSKREFVYNDGGVFLFNTRSEVSTPSALANDSGITKLYQQPTFKAKPDPNGYGYRIDIKTDVKVNLAGNALTHHELRLEINERGVYYIVSFAQPSANRIDYTITDQDNVFVDAGTLELDVEDQYVLIRDLIIPDVSIDQTRQDQLLEATFIDPNSVSQNRTQEFPFHYVNDLDPYVDSVRLRASDTLFYSGIEVTISQESIELLVQAENGTDGVNLYMPEQSQSAMLSSTHKLIESASAFRVDSMNANRVVLNWTESASSNIDRYELYYEEGTSASRDMKANPDQRINPGSGSSRTATVQGLSPNTDYTFALYAVDRSGNYSPARTITIRTDSSSGANDGEIWEGVQSPASYYLIQLNQTQLPEGRSLLQFVPFKQRTSGGQTIRDEFTVGAKQYLVNYNPSPYVYVTNIYNGQIFESNDRTPMGANHEGNPIAGPVLQIKPVNIPAKQWDDIRIILNDQVDKIRTNDAGFPSSYRLDQRSDLYPHSSGYANGNYSSFEEFRFYFSGNDVHPNRRGDDWKLKSGLNKLRLEVYPEGTLDNSGNPIRGAEPITTFEYEIYYFSDNLPEVVSLDIEKSTLNNGTFVQLENVTTRYYTQEKSVQFQTFVRNAESVELRYNYMDENDVPQQASVLAEWNGSRFVATSGDAFLFNEALQSVKSAESNANTGTADLFTRRLNLAGTGTYTLEVIATNDAGLTSSRMIEIIREPANFVVHYPLIDPETKIGTVNGNFTRFYVEAEKADKILVGKNIEVSETVPVELSDGEVRELYVFEVPGLKRGKNDIKFTVIRGQQQEEATVTLYHADTAVPGAEFKESIDRSRIRAFDRSVEVRFPKGTVLKRNDSRANDQALSPMRDIFVGIADPVDGRVNKMLHPAFNEQGSPFKKKDQWDTRYMLLREPTNRFRPISHLYWIDGGMVGDSQQDVLFGSGSYPYERDQEFYTRNADNRGEMFVPSQPGTLTLSYDPNMVDSAWRYITVYHYGYNEDHLGNKRYEWKNIGGVVDTKKHTITVPIEEFGYYVVMYMEHSYDDIIGHPWARDFLDTLYAKGMMMPKGSNRFETNDPISRGEFVTLIVKAFELPLNYEMQGDFSNSDEGWRGIFSDVGQVSLYSDGLYSYKYIETAGRAGIVRGTINNRFLPDANISREQAAAIIARAANLKLESNNDKIMKALESEFTDAADIDDYAKASVLAVVKKGLLEGKPNITGSTGDKPTYYFDPKASMTRAEAAVIIMKVMLDSKRVPSL